MAITWKRISRPDVAVALSMRICSWSVGDIKTSLIELSIVVDGLRNNMQAAMIDENALTQI